MRGFFFILKIHYSHAAYGDYGEGPKRFCIATLTAKRQMNGQSRDTSPDMRMNVCDMRMRVCVLDSVNI